ncbi:hypothetical protein [Mycobacterium pseudoshottsii]|uniref:hypothetical protein n=1 Tax=Mycobacterium pseudoshottsii TaxID=265949 RepID=UPI000B06D9EA|nr:hypothetical protein [Mycobacterium pseudoshottsii]
MAVDTSSAAADRIAVVGPAAAAVASLRAEPIPVSSVAAAAIAGGCATTYDNALSLLASGGGYSPRNAGTR